MKGEVSKRSLWGATKKQNSETTKQTSVTDTSGRTNEGGQDLATRRSRSVILGRGLFTLFLLIVAGIMGFLSFWFLAESEIVLVEEQYYSMTASALTATQTLAVRTQLYNTFFDMISPSEAKQNLNQRTNVFRLLLLLLISNLRTHTDEQIVAWFGCHGQTRFLFRSRCGGMAICLG